MKKSGILFIFFFSLAILFAQDKADTSTAADWTTNCAQRYEYHNKLIFSATETTDAAGKRTNAWMAQNRKKLLAVFQNLALDRIPAFKARRDKIIAGIGRAPGGGSVVYTAELGTEIDRFWKDIEAAAKKHGADCAKK